MINVKKKCVAFIFARGGSKGIPYKNIAPLLGKPLIAYSIETALACPSIERVIVSTDDEKIAEISKQYGAEVPFLRPKELAQDNSSEWLAWQHAIQFIQKTTPLDIFVALPPTAPLRAVEDVEKCIQTFLDDNVDMIITVKEAERNPYFNMVKIDNLGLSSLVLNSDFSVGRRQDAPLIYDVTTVAYVARPEFILKSKNIFDGRVKSVVIPKKRAIDIDDALDLKIAEILMKENV